MQELLLRFRGVPKSSALQRAPKRVPRALFRQRGAVVHPGVKDIIEADVAIATYAASVLEKLPRLKWMALKRAVDSFAAALNDQLDMRLEAHNLRTFRENSVEIVSKNGIEVPSIVFLPSLSRQPFFHGVPREGNHILSAGVSAFRLLLQW